MTKGQTKNKIKHKSRRHQDRDKKQLKKRTRKSSASRSVSTEIDLDMTDKSLRDFQASKSISVATTKTDITSSKIGELYEVKPIHDNIQRLCQMKVAGKIAKEYAKEYPNPKMVNHVSKQICACLFEKNRGLRIAELEKLVKTRMDTPGSSCISILDKNSRISKKSSRSRKSSRRKSGSKSSVKSS